MFKGIKKWLIYISLGFTVLLSYFFFRNIDFNKEWAIIKNAKWPYIEFAGLFLIFSHYLRGARWRILIMPIYPKVRLMSCFLAFLAGTLSNFVFPHSGDILRCGILKKIEKSPVDIILGTVILERFVDSIIIFGLFLISCCLAFTKMQVLIHELDFFSFKFSSVTVLLLFSFIVGLFIFYYLFQKSAFVLSLQNNIGAFFKSIKMGFYSFKKIKNKMHFSFLSFLIWGLYFLATGLLLNALPTTIPIPNMAILSVLVMASLGWAAPTQGGIGAFHFLVAKTLIIYGIANTLGVTLAIFLHAIFSIFDISFGLTALIILKIYIAKTDQKTNNLILETIT